MLNSTYFQEEIIGIPMLKSRVYH